MNYEELYAALQPSEKKLKDMNQTAQKLYKTILKDTENGDLRDLAKTLSVFSDLLENQKQAVEALQAAVSGFDGREYLESGDFARQMLEACADRHVDVQGEYPVYEMFPYKVKFDTESQDIYINKKKTATLRPAALVQTVKAGQEKLKKVSFNELTFLGELSDAYDLALLTMGKEPGYDLYFTRLYKFLVPMGRSRKEYDMQSYAYDLARLYAAHMNGLETTKSGRRFQFGPSRNGGKSVRILDGSGQEQFLTTICFY